MPQIKVDGKDKEVTEGEFKDLANQIATQAVATNLKTSLKEKNIAQVMDYILKPEGESKLVAVTFSDENKWMKEIESLRKGEAGPTASAIIQAKEKFENIGMGTKPQGISASERNPLRDIANKI